jgi:hypothetical protein
MEGNMARSKANTKAKIPEIERTLELVRFLKEKQVGQGAGVDIDQMVHTLRWQVLSAGEGRDVDFAVQPG